jgi:hypothetical protein
VHLTDFRLAIRSEALDAFIVGAEGVVAGDGALSLVVELQVDPVDGVVALAFLGPADDRSVYAVSELVDESGEPDVSGLDNLVALAESEGAVATQEMPGLGEAAYFHTYFYVLVGRSDGGEGGICGMSSRS